MNAILIEDVTKSPTEWGVSITSSNPEPGDYFQCADKEHAVRLCELLEGSQRSKKSSSEDLKTFEETVKPVMKWLAENRHPHTKIILESNCAELLEGVESVVTNEFLVD